MATGHAPVMLRESVEALALSPGSTVVDATFGGGGHARLILDQVGESGRLVGIDRDPDAAGRAGDLAGDDRFEFRRGAYDRVLARMVENGERADAVLFDLGLSSFQIDDPERGFSYVEEGPLDMRMDPSSGTSAADFLNEEDEAELARVFVLYGDVPRGEARRVAREVVRRRPLHVTTELAAAVRGAVGWRERGGNPSKRIFQAVRVHVNDEVGGLLRALEAAEALLVAGGRLAVISFHSGEDRAVKRFIADRQGRCICPPQLPVCVCGAEATMRRGVVRKASAEEVRQNPRSASARLRSATRVGAADRSGGREDVP
jgi:16S rRNA (cytosine1402-N4)-methyltransferase